MGGVASAPLGHAHTSPASEAVGQLGAPGGDTGRRRSRDDALLQERGHRDLRADHHEHGEWCEKR